jgi:hypothetical protein
MSLQLSAKAPVRVFSVRVDESRSMARPARGRTERSERATPLGMACRDVLDEVRFRMAVRGYHWDA